MNTIATTGYFVTPAHIKNASSPTPCILLQTLLDEDGEALDCHISYFPSLHVDTKRHRYVEPEHFFETEALANEYIADQVQRRMRALTRAYSRRTRPLRELTKTYEQKKTALKALLRTAEKRIHKQQGDAIIVGIAMNDAAKNETVALGKAALC
jgi:hypothetical protein